MGVSAVFVRICRVVVISTIVVVWRGECAVFIVVRATTIMINVE